MGRKGVIVIGQGNSSLVSVSSDFDPRDDSCVGGVNVWRNSLLERVDRLELKITKNIKEMRLCGTMRRPTAHEERFLFKTDPKEGLWIGYQFIDIQRRGVGPFVRPDDDSIDKGRTHPNFVSSRISYLDTR